jgi:(1->4)-alpha-D-glucan 1-alpha-D-glucosylmutase
MTMQRVEPIATYRLQLTPSFGFDDTLDVLDHIRQLGASHVYLSPISQAVPESSHGYDVVDHTTVRAEFGGAPGFERLLEELAARSMAAVIDHVPNHVASTRPDLNRPWWDLLRDGPGSPADRWFDVDWEAGDGRVVLPILGGSLDEVLDDGHVRIDGDSIVVYGERRLPVRADASMDGRSLADVLAEQHYVLQHWREPLRNVRRFFTIDDLVAVRVEHADVAEVVDTIPARYASTPGFGGVRVDHVDGLADPLGYLTGLRERIGDDALIWVEKIVAAGEWLPAAWPVDGTTGYEFIRVCDHTMLARDALDVVDRRWIEDSGDRRPFHDWESAARREVVEQGLAPDLARLGRLATAIVDAPDADVTDELRRLTTELPRYRTYLPDDEAAHELIGSISAGPVAATLLAPDGAGAIELRTRWQQLTGPVMAKGAEDRAFYRYLRLASLCEVGGDPGRFGVTVADFHAENARRQQSWPHAMLAASTHDTKRSDDVRARSAALTWRAASEPDRVADVWGGLVGELVGSTGAHAVPASLAVQTALTAPGLDARRLTEYLVKAEREAALRTSWEDPDADGEGRLAHLADAAIAATTDDLLDLDEIATGVSLAGTALRLTSPGVPDVYQGTEAFTHRLVDPDNRVPPDWAELDSYVTDDRTVAEAWSAGSPAVKTLLVRALLGLRRQHPAAFGAQGTYEPLDVGPGAIAFVRGDAVVVVVRRGAATVAAPMTFPAGTWYDVLDPGAPTLSGTIDTASAVGTGEDGTIPVAVFERA